MKPIKEIKTLDNQQLMEIVKNYRLHGFSRSQRSEALAVLEQRGMDQNLLRRMGVLDNLRFEKAMKPFTQFRRNSRIGFGIYLFFIFLMMSSYFTEPNWLISTLLLLSFMGFSGFLLLSFNSQERFFSAIGKNSIAESPLIFFFMGMPLYFIMYYHFKKLMQDELVQLA